MKEFNYTITDKEGIHMRPAGELVKAAKQFESSILIKKDGKTADCKNVISSKMWTGSNSKCRRYRRRTGSCKD